MGYDATMSRVTLANATRWRPGASCCDRFRRRTLQNTPYTIFDEQARLGLGRLLRSIANG
jgi:hypothetical protein